MELISNAIAHLANRHLRRLGGRIPCSRAALEKAQERNWGVLRKGLESTAIYRDLGLHDIRSYADFLRRVPVQGYEFYEKYVERLESGERQVLFRDECADIALTSGTSGYDSKRVPLNGKMLHLFRTTQMLLAARVTQLEHGAIDFLRFNHLTFGSTPSLYRKGELNYGYISGILTSRMPPLLRKNTFPSPRVISMPDWSEKLDALVEETVRRDVRIVSGIPSYILAIFERVLQHTGARQIQQVWPALEVFLYSGTPIGAYFRRIDEVVGRKLRYYGFYTSTEAPIGISHEAFPGETQLYLLNPKQLFSFSVPGSSDVVGIRDIQCGTPYHINVGTPNGFVHYALCDVVEFQEIDGALTFKLVGRRGDGLNLAAEKVTLDELLQAVNDVTAAIGQELHHFFVTPSTDEQGRPAYEWTLFVGRPADLNSTACAAALDSALQRRNLDYRDCRKVGVIGPPVVCGSDAGFIERLFESNRHKGQYKLRSVFASPGDRSRFLGERAATVSVSS